MIGGNTEVKLLYNTSITMNEVGERAPTTWSVMATLTGYLDLMSGEAKYTYNAKLQESTHIFICDYVELDKRVDNKRMWINGQTYDVLLIDDPMGMHQHLEIYLRYIGK